MSPGSQSLIPDQTIRLSNSRPLIARTPIFDPSNRVMGYEAGRYHAPQDGENPIESCLINALAREIDINTIVGEGRQLFIPVSESVLEQGLYSVLPPQQVVLVSPQTSSCVESTDRILANAVDSGYELAVNALAGNANTSTIPNHASYIRVDLGTTDDATLRLLVGSTRSSGVRVIAMHVDDAAAHKRAMEHQCDLIHGEFCSAPASQYDSQPSGMSILHLRLLSLLTKSEFKLDEISDTIKSDLSLSHSLLRRINSVHMGVREKVTSVHHALAMMGEHQIRAWGGYAALATMNTTHPRELIVRSVMRARLCERLASESNRSILQLDAFFTGMLSAIDVIMGIPIGKAIEPLHLADHVADVLLGQRETPLGRLYSLVEACERGAWSTAQEHRVELNISHSSLVREYYGVLNWSHEAFGDNS